MRGWRALPMLGWCALMACGQSEVTESGMPSSSGGGAEAVVDSIPDVRIPPLRELMGRVSPAQDSSFAPIPSELCSRDGMHLRRTNASRASRRKCMPSRLQKGFR